MDLSWIAVIVVVGLGVWWYLAHNAKARKAAQDAVADAKAKAEAAVKKS